MKRRNREWVERVSKNLIDIALENIGKYGCENSAISSGNLKEYEVNNKKNNSKNISKSSMDYSMKVIIYLPAFSKN